MPLPSELSTVFLGGLFLLALLDAVYAAREIVLPVVLAFVLHLLLAPALRVLERLRTPRMLATCSRSPRPYRRPVKSKTTTTMAMTPMTPISTVTVAVSIAAELATEAAEKEDHEKDEED